MRWQEWSVQFERHCAVPGKFHCLINNATEPCRNAFRPSRWPCLSFLPHQDCWRDRASANLLHARRQGGPVHRLSALAIAVKPRIVTYGGISFPAALGRQLPTSAAAPRPSSTIDRTRPRADGHYSRRKRMFRTAVVNVLKKNWLLILGVVIVSTAGLYWRDQHISLLVLCSIVLVPFGALILVAVPVELHKLRNGR